MPVNSAVGLDIPSTLCALWLRGTDRGELFHRSKSLEELLVPADERGPVRFEQT